MDKVKKYKYIKYLRCRIMWNVPRTLLCVEQQQKINSPSDGTISKHTKSWIYTDNQSSVKWFPSYRSDSEPNSAQKKIKEFAKFHKATSGNDCDMCVCVCVEEP